MPDKTLKCKDCNADFVFSEKDQKFFESKGFEPPKRCKPCRDVKKQASKSQGS
jgi:hypothetical protein